MLNRLTRTLATMTMALVVLAVPGTTSVAEELPFPFTIEGSWWCSMGKRGVMRLDFGPIFSGDFQVSGAGISKDFEEAFRIRIESQQYMTFQPNRNIVGELTLRNLENTEDIGILTITKGKLNFTKTRMRLKGRLEMLGKDDVKVRMKCIRIPDALPDWEGRTTDGRVRGQRLRSDKYDFTVIEHTAIGFPFFHVIATGPVVVDGEPSNTFIDGVLGAQPNGRVFADLMSHEDFATVGFGEGFGTGKFVPPPTGLFNRPSIRLKSKFAERGRLNYRGILLEIIGN